MGISSVGKKAAAWRILLPLAAFIFNPWNVSARFDFDASCREAYRAILSLQFDQASKILRQKQQSDPENMIPVYLENYSDFLAVFISEDQQQFEKLREALSDRSAQIRKNRDDSPWYGYSLASMRLQFALTRLKFGEYKSATVDFAQVYGDFESNARKYPDFLPGKTGLGLIHILAGMIPDNYSWLLGLFGIDGDIGKGLDELSGVALYEGNDDVFQLFGTEAMFYLAMIDASLGKNKQDPLRLIRDFDLSGKDFPGSSNPLYIFVKSTILMRNGLNDEAIRCMNNYRKGTGDFPFFYIDYLNGLARINRVDPEAERFLLRFLGNFTGRNYLKSAYQKLAWVYLLNGDTARYKEYMSRIPVRGETLVDADRQAEKDAENLEIPNVTLLRARLLFDGGYYDQALDELLNSRLKDFIRTKKDMIEYTYRLGRIYHESGNISKALAYYEQAISTGGEMPWYFAANAALQSGLIYESRNDPENAARCYRLCLSMKNDEYKTSLDQKAKAGLKRLRK